MSNFGRRTWDREEYLKHITDRNNEQSSLKEVLTPNQLQELKQRYTDYDALIKESLENLNKKVLTTALSSFKKGKQFGFYCKLCDLTFKDNLQYIDHLNHKTHSIRFELVFDEPLLSDQRDNDEVSVVELKEAYDNVRKTFIRKNTLQQNKTNKKKKIKSSNNHPTTYTDSMSQVQLSMGFGSFGTSKI